MPSDGKGSHCLWQGELKSNKHQLNNIFLSQIQITPETKM
jgi:hypothetical protein